MLKFGSEPVRWGWLVGRCVYAWHDSQIQAIVETRSRRSIVSRKPGVAPSPLEQEELCVL